MQVAAPKPKAIRRAHPGQGVPMWHASKWPNQRSCVENGERGLGRDHLYSVAALTNAAGSVVERYRYDSHGSRVVLAADGVTTRAASLYGNQIGFTGRYLDKETGLWYFRARYYSGSLGRFIGRDPLKYVDGKNLYQAYFIPNKVDPFGLAAEGEECTTRGAKEDGSPVYSDYKWEYHKGGVAYAADQLAKIAEALKKGTQIDKILKLASRVDTWWVLFLRNETTEHFVCVCKEPKSTQNVWKSDGKPTVKKQYSGIHLLEDTNGGADGAGSFVMGGDGPNEPKEDRQTNKQFAEQMEYKDL